MRIAVIAVIAGIAVIARDRRGLLLSRFLFFDVGDEVAMRRDLGDYA